jgi:hypothetical protein
MRRFLTDSFIVFVLLIGAFGASPVTHAQTPTDGIPCDFTSEGTQDGIWQSGKCISNGTYGFNNTTSDTEANISANKAGTTLPSDAKTAITPALGKDASSQFGFVMQYIMMLFAWLVGVAALVLDNAVYFTVVTMGDYVKHLTAVGVTWRILRDIGNIMLIFGFLAVGITTILNVEWYGGGKKMLPMMLVAAVFLNFSLFISEAVIDAGNLFATQFYTQINGGNPAGAKGFDPGFSIRLTNEGISNKLMAQLGLQAIYDGTRNTKIFDAGNTWVIGFMGILLFIVTAFVMFSLSFVLIARFVALIFLIILAPVGFAGLAVPQLAARAKQWWDKLFEQTVTAPILLLMLYIALAVITDAQFLTGLCIPGTTGTTGGVNTNTTCSVNPLGWVSGNFQGFASFLLSFLVAMGLLLAVVIQSKRLAAFGAEGASKLAGKLTFGATAWGMRQTAGRGIQAASKRFNASRLSRIPGVGRAASNLMARGATASFDVRGVTAGGGLGAVGIDAGKAQEGGFRAMQKASKEASKAHDTETKIGRLKKELAKRPVVTSEINKIMRGLGDDDLKDDGLLDLIKSNPLAVQSLTNHQVTLLPDGVLTTPTVFQNLTIGQMEAYRAAGNAAPGAAGAPMQVWLAAHQYDGVYMAGRNGADQIAIKAFWHLP